MGRRAMSNSEKRRAISFRLHPDVIARIKAMAKEEQISQAKTIERLVQGVPIQLGLPF